MGVLADIDRFLTRAFNPGSAAVDRSTHVFGVDPTTFSPQEYVDYLASSNNVYVCATLRAELLASLPLRLYRLQRNGDRTEVTSGPLSDLMHKVNPFWTMSRLMEMTELSLCTWGSAFWAVEKSGAIPRELWWVRSDRMRVVPHPTNYVSGYLYQPVAGQEPISFAADEVVWIRRANPIDEYSGLSPLAAARLAADISSAASRSNRNLFSNGISLGGLVSPVGEDTFSTDHANELVALLKNQGRGVENAHRWIVLKQDAKFTAMNLSPKDAEYLGSMKWNLEEIARAYRVPLDLVGGQRTYENVDAAMKAIWTNCLIPEGRLIASELTEQLLPMFGNGGADLAEFDTSGVKVLQDDEQAAWTIAQGQLQSGVKTINEVRESRGEKPVLWGDVWWGSVALVPIKDAELPGVEGGDGGGEPDSGEDEGDQNANTDRIAQLGVHGVAAPDSGRGVASRHMLRIAYDSDEHKRAFRLFTQRTDKHEERVRRTAKRLFRQQEQSILTALGKIERAAEPDDADALMGKILNLARWKRRFRETMRPEIGKIVADAGQTAVDEVMVGVAFDVSDPSVARFMERRAQRFAVEVNETTWDALKKSLTEGLDAGEGTDVLAKRVREVMGDRIRSSEEVIARTETIGAYNGGTVEGYRQSGVVESKTWMASLDDRTRETHVAAHGQTVALDSNFDVGGGSGPAPGQIGLPEEDIQCRCFLIAGLAPLEE